MVTYEGTKLWFYKVLDSIISACISFRLCASADYSHYNVILHIAELCLSLHERVGIACEGHYASMTHIGGATQ